MQGASYVPSLIDRVKGPKFVDPDCHRTLPRALTWTLSIKVVEHGQTEPYDIVTIDAFLLRHSSVFLLNYTRDSATPI